MKIIPGFPGFKASADGRIFCGDEETPQHRRVRGYSGVLIGGSPYLVSRLVALAFHGLPPTKKHECLHLDDDRENNHWKNLKWGTHAENMKMCAGDERLSHKGDKNNKAKLTELQVREIRAAYDNKTGHRWGESIFAARFGVTKTQIGRIARREKGGWKHV